MRKFVYIAFLTGVCAASAQADNSDANSAAALLTKHASLKEQLSHNQFQLPPYLDSKQNSGDLRGDIYAVVEHPFATVS